MSILFTEKKTRSKKEKPSDVSDGISDLLAQMTLQSSSSTNAATQPQTLLTTISNMEKPEAVALDTPVNQKQHRKTKEEHNSLPDCPNTPVPNAESEDVASLSVSAVIDALHLSEIDWDALSFTSSPPPQTAANQKTDPRLNKITDVDVKETQGENIKQQPSSDVKQADSRSAPELCYTECPLRDRVLMKNTAKAINQRKVDDGVVSKQLNYELPSLEHISSFDSDSKPSGQMSTKSRHDGKLVGKKSDVNRKEQLTRSSQYKTNKVEMETKTSKQPLMPAVQDQCKAKDKCNELQKPPHKYKFFRTAISSSAVPPERCQDQDRNVPQTTKKSVCMSVCSSSEDSDTENQQLGPQRKAKSKATNKTKGSFITDFPLKLVPGPKTSKPTMNPTHCLQPLEPTSQKHSADVEINSTPVSCKSRCQDVSPAIVDGDVFLQSPASPVTVLDDDDDSVICGESPLPLAERLRLKFLK